MLIRKYFPPILALLLFCGTYHAQTCPVDMVCITPAAARQALADSDTVKAQKSELAVKDQAIADLKELLANMRIQFAEKSGENTALKQNAVSDRAIITELLKYSKKKCMPLSVCF